MSLSSAIVAVTGAAGAQASAIGRAFLSAGYHVRGLSRFTQNGPYIAHHGMEPVIVDPTDPDRLSRAFEGAQIVAFNSPVDYRPKVRERLAESVARAAERAGVARIVLNTGAEIYDGYDRPVTTVLREVREIVRSSTVPTVTVQPTAFMDNLLGPWSASAIVNDGVFAYPVPSDCPISWVSHQSLAAYAVAAAHAPAGKIYRIGGPAPITGTEMARTLSQVLGREVLHHALPLDSFGAALNNALGVPSGDYIADYYRRLLTAPDALARDMSLLAELNVEPESFDAWTRRQPWWRFGATGAQRAGHGHG